MAGGVESALLWHTKTPPCYESDRLLTYNLLRIIIIDIDPTWSAFYGEPFGGRSLMHTTGQAFFEETEVRGCIVVLYCSVFYLLLTPVPSTEDVALALQKRQDQQDTFRNGAGGSR